MISITVNGAVDQVPAGSTVTQFLEAHRFPTRGVAVAIDGVIVPKSTWATTVLSPGVSVEVVTAAAGG